MKCLDRFNKKMSLGGGSLRNENIINSRNLLQETFSDDASLAQGIYLWRPELMRIKSYENEKPLTIRLYKRTHSNIEGVLYRFQTLYDTPIYPGDVIYDSCMEQYLLCRESFNIDNIHWQGKFLLCNWILKWQNKNGDILEYPCYDMNSTQYNSGEKDGKVYTLGSSHHVLTLPSDENTIVLKHPQRFILDKEMEHPTTFIVTQNDTTAFNYGKKGLIKVTVIETPHNPETDRIDLGICDYIDKNKLVVDNSNDKYVSKSVISYDTNVIKSGGSKQKFTGNFFGKDGKEIVGIVPHWNIICDFSHALQAEEVGNQLLIGIDNDEYIDEEFKIVLSDVEGNYSSSLIVKVESLI